MLLRELFKLDRNLGSKCHITPLKGTEAELREAGGAAVRLVFGELAFLTDKKQLIVGDPEAENGYHLVSEVVEGPHDKNLYSKLDETRLIPLGFR